MLVFNPLRETVLCQAIWKFRFHCHPSNVLPSKWLNVCRWFTDHVLAMWSPWTKMEFFYFISVKKLKTNELWMIEWDITVVCAYRIAFASPKFSGFAFPNEFLQFLQSCWTKQFCFVGFKKFKSQKKTSEMPQKQYLFWLLPKHCEACDTIVKS